ncbi:TIR-NBS-LRR disease resistance protein [Melia azedarach]|uniref:TIR-NBS-LRR disease resistance protein n=1 Tax=Melia azedarach TaxID=155640 RepID=A0ACC1Y0Q4_MELAZ|nr:TIR-NBS-LRR disease resistance protein [Melia azedarach]
MASTLSKWAYQVFLSFRGEDTRTNFTDHLFLALVHAGIHTFRDDIELQRGEDICSELLEAIENSRISVIIFSKNYADSRWCLDELVKIMECKKNVRQTVLPVFYDISPSEVRNQTGLFAEAFTKHESRFKFERVERWRKALTEAANLSGWDLHEASKGHESKYIQKIVEEITIKLAHRYFTVSAYPVAIDSHVECIHTFLGLEDLSVRKIGICGMGGIGKTTIAKAVYNQTSNCFEGSCFLEDVGEIAKQSNGLLQLQKRMLSELLLKKMSDIESVDRGINMMKGRLHHRRIFVVLDNVDHISQLKALAGENKWFGSGSRIIITTRNEHLLKVFEVDDIYMVPRLSKAKSLQLFSWHAFRKDDPSEAFRKRSKEIIDYAAGLPLALEVLGSFLFNQTSIDVWNSAVEKLKRIPNRDILNKLRISFDGLNDDEEKNVFLDIAFFFIGMDKDYVLQILNGCGFSSEIDFHVLTQRCLLVIDEDNRLRMHDLVRDMGREIVRQESLKYPGKRSRLWFHEDVLDVLANHSGTSEVEGLVLDRPCSKDVNLTTEAFAEMYELRLLSLKNTQLSGDYRYLSKKLRWLCWHGFQLKDIPPSFHLDNLVALDMRYSSLTQIWKENRVLNKLKVLKLSHSYYLTKTPNFDGLPNLEKLVLKDCPRLVEIHSSIGKLVRLVCLNLKDCKALKCLPTSTCKLKSLEILILSDCSKLAGLPEDLGKLEQLRVLLADRTAIKQLPFSINLLKNLRILSLRGCEGASLRFASHSIFWSWISRRNPDPISLLPNSLSGLRSLRGLDLSNCKLSDNTIPADIGSLTSLLQLDLGFNNFSCLPDTINHLSSLQTLWLNGCTMLQSIPVLPRNLVYLIAPNCTSLERILDVSNLQTQLSMTLNNCQRLAEIQGLDKLESTGSIFMDRCNNLSDKFRRMLLQDLPNRCVRGISVPGNQVPDWYNYQSVGSIISFQVPPVLNCPIKGLTICVVYAAEENDLDTLSFGEFVIKDLTKNLEWNVSPDSSFPVTRQDHMWVVHIPHSTLDNQLEAGDRVEVSVSFLCSLDRVKCGIQLLYDQTMGSLCSEELSLVPYTSYENADIATAGSIDGDAHALTGKGESMLAKRSIYDTEAGPSGGNTKRLRIEYEQWKQN